MVANYYAFVILKKELLYVCREFSPSIILKMKDGFKVLNPIH